LMAGADLVLPDCHLNPQALIDMIEKLRPTVAGAVPTIWNDLLHYLEKEPDHDLSSLRLVACGGSAVPVSLMRTFEDKYGVLIKQLWGMTETSPLATMAWPPPGTPDDRHWAYRATVGQPVCGVEMRIVDDEGGVLPNDGEAVGEVEVRGPWVTGSYYRGRDDSKFDSGWLRTGDVGRMDAKGFVYIEDRKKDMILVSGFNVYPNEVEAAVVTHPGVLEAAAVAQADEHSGEVVALFVVRKDPKLTEKDVMDHARKSLAGYKVPKHIYFKSELPKTNVGKILRKALREELATR
jgi:fatty-acyl-CoA synthase